MQICIFAFVVSSSLLFFLKRKMMNKRKSSMVVCCCKVWNRVRSITSFFAEPSWHQTGNSPGARIASKKGKPYRETGSTKSNFYLIGGTGPTAMTRVAFGKCVYNIITFTTDGLTLNFTCIMNNPSSSKRRDGPLSEIDHITTKDDPIDTSDGDIIFIDDDVHVRKASGAPHSICSNSTNKESTSEAFGRCVVCFQEVKVIDAS